MKKKRKKTLGYFESQQGVRYDSTKKTKKN